MSDKPKEQETLEKLQHVMLQPDSRYDDWNRVTHHAREFYVRSAIEAMKVKLGYDNGADAKMVVAMIDQLYENPTSRRIKVSLAFGICYASFTRTETAGQAPLP